MLANADQRAEPRSCRLPLDDVSKVKDKKVKKKRGLTKKHEI